MARRNTIPQRAYRTAFTQGTATKQDGSTVRWTVEIWEGRASDGYKTGYEARPAVWLLIRADGKTHGCWRYTGNRTAKAWSDYEANVRDLSAASVPA